MKRSGFQVVRGCRLFSKVLVGGLAVFGAAACASAAPEDTLGVSTSALERPGAKLTVPFADDCVSIVKQPAKKAADQENV